MSSIINRFHIFCSFLGIRVLLLTSVAAMAQTTSLPSVGETDPTRASDQVKDLFKAQLRLAGIETCRRGDCRGTRGGGVD